MTGDATRHEILIPLAADAAWRLFTERCGGGADDYLTALGSEYGWSFILQRYRAGAHPCASPSLLW